jgi:hypothetical protein
VQWLRPACIIESDDESCHAVLQAVKELLLVLKLAVSKSFKVFTSFCAIVGTSGCFLP